MLDESDYDHIFGSVSSGGTSLSKEERGIVRGFHRESEKRSETECGKGKVEKSLKRIGRLF